MVWFDEFFIPHFKVKLTRIICWLFLCFRHVNVYSCSYFKHQCSYFSITCRNKVLKWNLSSCNLHYNVFFTKMKFWLFLQKPTPVKEHTNDQQIPNEKVKRESPQTIYSIPDEQRETLLFLLFHIICSGQFINSLSSS